MKTNAAKIQELIGLAMKVQETTEYCVFIRFSGHVDTLEIEIRESKKNYQIDVISAKFNTHGKYITQEHFNRRYQEMKYFMVDVLKKGQVDYNHDAVEQFERIEYDYKF